ncbi:hypothetical protein Vretimale_1697 [Volvox reticuliferus]|uniref:AAA+ ATPase domain-containing protein n=1 Tax=Volvox reticuliferus TaxID=1737510 RepID=A0A8J4DBB0_9CHLO|nr:hypothetical protein Vretifemale_15503 [Volvox reticuliferus]GIL95739.1 hypothetical protein Vretimale_1697 [Volvox reticuliferus]
MSFGIPSLTACLVDDTVPKLPAGSSWVALPPDSLISSRLAAGQVVLVGITSRVVQSPQTHGSPAAAGWSPRPTSGLSTFGPAPELIAPGDPSGQPPQPESLWRLCIRRLGLPALAGIDGDISCYEAAAQVGTYLLPARVWPAARKLPRSTLLLSPALRETAGQPPAGTVILLYCLSAIANVVSPSAPIATFTHAPAPGGGLGIPGAPSIVAGAADIFSKANAAPMPSGVGRCDAVVLQLCGEVLLQARVNPSGSGNSSDDRAMRPSPTAKSMRSSGAPVVPGQSPADRTPVPRAVGTGGGGNGTEPAPVGGGGPLQRWPLDVLRQSADAGDEAMRSTLAAVARRHLAGRYVLEGAPLLLPVLGSSVLFRVTATFVPAQADAASGLSYQHSGSGKVRGAMVEVGRDTTLLILYPGEPLPVQFRGQDDVAATGALATPGPGLGASVMQRVSEAREAAMAAVPASAAEAAANAAERALRAGMSAAGVTTSHLGGVGQYLHTLRELVWLPLKAPQLFKQYGIRPPRGVLLYGPPGSGKTVLARAAAADAGATVFLINGPDVVSEYYGESESSLRGIFMAASALAPSLIIMDEVDALAPARSGGDGISSLLPIVGGSDVASRLATALLTLLDGAEQEALQQQPYRPVVVVAATNRPDALDPALRRPGRLEREIEVGVPTPEARTEILQARMRAVRHCLRPEEVVALAASAHGFVSADLAALVDEATMCALRRRVAKGAARRREGEEGEPAVVTLGDFKTAETRVRPSGLREVAIEIPSVRWDDIGGMHSVKQALREAVEWPHKAQRAMARLGAQVPRGVLLFGPPGCSKTLLAKAVASEARLNFLAVKAGELVSKYVGESEKVGQIIG